MLQLAQQLLQQDGFTGLTMDRLTAVSEVSKGTIYNHFCSKEDLITQTKGVECRKDKAVIDEIPAAYKDIDEVMQNQSDLIEVVHTLKQVLCIKG